MDYAGLNHYDSAQSNDLLIYAGGSRQYPVLETVEESSYEITATGFVEETQDFTGAFPEAEFREIHRILADGGERFGVSAIAFDPQEELLWMGNQGGHVTSYYGAGMQKYTSFQVHANQEVRHIHAFEDGILALTQNALRCQMRRGIPIFTHSSDNMQEMQCFLQITPDTLLMAGHQDKIIMFNLTQGQETNLIDVRNDGCAILRQHGRYICAGSPLGQIDLRDPNTLHIEHTIEAHSGSLSDFDVHGNLLVTCGFSMRHGSLSVDRFLKMYDLRMMRAVTPLPVALDPLLLRFLPSFSSRLAVVSALGQMQLLETVALTDPTLCLYQLQSGGAMCLTFDVSQSCQCLAFGDASGFIHLYTSNPHTAMFNSFSRETEFADPVEPIQPISFNDYMTPLSSIPLPYVQGSSLLSDWPEQYLSNTYRRTPAIDPEILRTMKIQGTIGYAPNPMGCRRNQVPYKQKKKHGNRASSRLFGNDSSQGQISDDASFIAIPKRYRKVEIKYSKQGVGDVDYDMYNKTGFCGLEAVLPNSYCNAMLQVLYYTGPVRNLLLSHLCQKEFCLSCELGFLFHMLDISQGLPCQSNNFLRAFRTVPEASALGLILSDVHPDSKKKANFIRLIQSWNRFILHQIHYEMLEEKKTNVKDQTSTTVLESSGFIYNEDDFPSILDRVYSRSNHKHNMSTETDTSKVTRNVEGQPKDFWLTNGVIDGDVSTKIQDDSVDNAGETIISNLFGIKQIHTQRCLKCKTSVCKEVIALLCNLQYPEMAEGKMEYSFCDVLKTSLCPQTTSPAWCDKCNRYCPTVLSRKIKKMPNILALNCGLETSQDKKFWQTQMDLIVKKISKEQTKVQKTHPKSCRYGDACTRPNCRYKHDGQSEDGAGSSLNHMYYTHPWLPLHIQATLEENGSVNILKMKHQDDIIDQDSPDQSKSQKMIYDLAAVVCHINESQQNDKKNLVALINVTPSYHERSMGSPVNQWYIFNDFSISPVPAQEVVWFSLDWKVPCVLYWVNRNIPKDVLPLQKNPVTIDVFSEDKSLATNCRSNITFTPLATDEIPGKGDIVAIDAEFVTINQEESELRSDGRLSTIKPSHMSVARISCIRGQGPLQGTAFIDDYISTQEQVVDYLTKFSGIKPGDLDANFSSKHLTTLKSTYQKLRFLVDNGVKFVGHGLKNDFKVINLVVPQEQMIDTVLLYHLPHHRMVSLRFLAWHFLGIKIQSGSHDSIEDARTALQLYMHYLRMKEEGTLVNLLKELYEVGKRLNWVVPDCEDS